MITDACARMHSIDVIYGIINGGVAEEMSEGSGVRELEPLVSSRIRSGLSIDSFTQCARELVQNSVDSRASSLVVKVDTSTWKVQVLWLASNLHLLKQCFSGER